MHAYNQEGENIQAVYSTVRTMTLQTVTRFTHLLTYCFKLVWFYLL